MVNFVKRRRQRGSPKSTVFYHLIYKHFVRLSEKMAKYNFLRDGLVVIGSVTGLWYLLGDRGTNKINELTQANAQTKQATYNMTKEERILDVLKPGNKSADELTKLREESKEKRYKIADEYYKKSVEEVRAQQAKEREEKD